MACVRRLGLCVSEAATADAAKRELKARSLVSGQVPWVPRMLSQQLQISRRCQNLYRQQNNLTECKGPLMCFIGRPGPLGIWQELPRNEKSRQAGRPEGLRHPSGGIDGGAGGRALRLSHSKPYKSRSLRAAQSHPQRARTRRCKWSLSAQAARIS